jgi:hypothetical protein
MRLVRTDQLPGGNFFGQVELAPFHELDLRIPQSVKDQLNQLAQGLANDPSLDEVPYQKP